MKYELFNESIHLQTCNSADDGNKRLLGCDDICRQMHRPNPKSNVVTSGILDDLPEKWRARTARFFLDTSGMWILVS